MKTLVSFPCLPSVVLGLGLLLATSAAVFAQSQPIVGTGYNVDGIADIAATPATATNFTTHLAGITFGLDGQFAYIEKGFNGGTAANGITTGNFTSAAGTGTVFTIQPAAGPNVLEAQNGGGTGTFTLTTPTRYSSLTGLETGFNGNQSFSFALNYTTGAATTGTGTAGDNFGGTPFALNAAGRTSTTGVDNNTTNPRLYEAVLTGIDPTRLLSSITITATTANTGTAGSAQAVAFFGFSGTAVPEPSTWAMMLVGGAGLIGYVRARRSVQA